MPKTIDGLSQREYFKRWRKRNPDKVAKALKENQDYRVIRNKDHREMAKKTKLKNFDVHHTKNGSKKIVQRHHGRDKK